MSTKRAAKKIDLHEAVRGAILKAVQGGGLRTRGQLAFYGDDILATKLIRTFVDQTIGDLISSGAIVKLKGVYHLGFVGNPGGEEAPEPQMTEEQAFSSTKPMTAAERKRV